MITLWGHDRQCTFEPPLWNHNNMYKKTTSHTHVFLGGESVMLQQLHTQGMQPIVSIITNT
jgi:hypothetical protein